MFENEALIRKIVREENKKNLLEVRKICEELVIHLFSNESYDEIIGPWYCEQRVKTLRTTIRLEINSKTESAARREFADKWRAEVISLAKDVVSGEDFLDKFVQRIKNKQIN